MSKTYCEETKCQMFESTKKQIRADAIDECIKAIKKYWHFWNIGVIAKVIEVLERLKSQTDTDEREVQNVLLFKEQLKERE